MALSLGEIYNKVAQSTATQKLGAFLLASPVSRSAFSNVAEFTGNITNSAGIGATAGITASLITLAAAFTVSTIGLSEIFSPNENKENTINTEENTGSTLKHLDP